MKVTDAAQWNRIVEINTDPYGKAVVDYARRWAELMEEQMESGTPLGDCAKELSFTADKEGITGYMYGCAVQILSECWEYGEQLRQWHNLSTQIKDEGERANKSGGVLNPALITLDGIGEEQTE